MLLTAFWAKELQASLQNQWQVARGNTRRRKLCNRRASKKLSLEAIESGKAGDRSIAEGGGTACSGPDGAGVLQ